MRKLNIVWLMLLLFVMAACQSVEDPTEEPTVPSDPTEVHPLSGAVDDFKALSNYTMHIELKQHHDVVSIIIQTDGQKASFQVDDEIEYLVKSGTNCERYFNTSSGYMKASNPCDTLSNDYRFLKNIQADWFSQHEGTYYLNIQNYTNIEPFFQQALPNASVTNFELVVEQEVITGFIFDVTVSSIIYNLTITLSHIGTTHVEVPNVE